jgi:type VI secretion system protein ImpF
MPRNDSPHGVQHSILDRLIDEDPEVSTEPARDLRQGLRELRNAIRRDLECLLNTRLRLRPIPKGFDQLERSLLSYGVPDLTGANLASSNARRDFLRTIETAIKRCEPRFKSVKLSYVDDVDPQERTLHFRIEAVVHAEPVPESVVFDSELEPLSRTFELKV